MRGNLLALGAVGALALGAVASVRGARYPAGSRALPRPGGLQVVSGGEARDVHRIASLRARPWESNATLAWHGSTPAFTLGQAHEAWAADAVSADALVQALCAIEDILGALVFLLRVYRGLAIPRGGSVREQGPGAHWTPNRAVARAFALEQHEGNSPRPGRRNRTAIVLSGTVASAEDVDWTLTLDSFFRFSLDRESGEPYVSPQLGGDVYEEELQLKEGIVPASIQAENLSGTDLALPKGWSQ